MREVSPLTRIDRLAHTTRAHSTRARTTLALAGTLLLAIVVTGCGPKTDAPAGTTSPEGEAAASGLKVPSIAVNLPIEHNTPDGMAVDSQNNIILSCPNFNDPSHPAWLMKITPDDKLEEYIQIPVSPETNRACPLGIGFGADGNLYVADCQALGGGTGYTSRLLKVTVEDGKPLRCEVVVNGFVNSNAVAAYGNDIYVTETKLIADPEGADAAPSSGPLASGVYKFSLDELDPANPITLKPGGTDPHLILQLSTKSEEWAVGANGLGFAKDGTMYVCNFGDAQLIGVTFDADGKPTQKIIAEGGPMKSTDGLKVDAATGAVFIADFVGNAVHRVNPESGDVVVIAQNGQTDGTDGLLDKCSEVCIRDNKLYVANIDLDGFAGNTFDKPYTISVIDLDD